MNSSPTSVSNASSSVLDDHCSEAAADDGVVPTSLPASNESSEAMESEFSNGPASADCSTAKNTSLNDSVAASNDVSNGGSSKVQGDDYSLSVDDLEEVLIELNNYERIASKDHKYPPIPSLLDSYLRFVARAGCTHFPWTKVKWLFRAKLEQVIMDIFESFPLEDVAATPNVDSFNFAIVKDKVFEQLEAFSGIPFTVQRIAELLTAPRRHYRRTDKFMRALEKNMLVVSTVEARSRASSATAEEPIVNGDHSLLLPNMRPGNPVLPGTFTQQSNAVNSSNDGVVATAGVKELQSSSTFDLDQGLSSSSSSIPISGSIGEDAAGEEDQTDASGESSCSSRDDGRGPAEEEVVGQEVTGSSEPAPAVCSDEVLRGDAVEEDSPTTSTAAATNDAQPLPLPNEKEAAAAEGGQATSSSERSGGRLEEDVAALQRESHDDASNSDAAALRQQEAPSDSSSGDVGPESCASEKDGDPCDSGGKESTEISESSTVDSNVSEEPAVGSKGNEAECKQSGEVDTAELPLAASTVDEAADTENEPDSEAMEVDSECSEAGSRILEPHLVSAPEEST